MTELLFKKECYLIIGICMKVHSILKRGFKEIVYKDALEIEFIVNNIPHVREPRFEIGYLGKTLRHGFEADFLLYGSIILEVKAKPFLHYDNFEQTLNYLKSGKIKLGLLVNFGEPSLRHKRIICTY